MAKESPKRPVSFVLVKWYGYIFVATFVLYGGVKIVLGFMDHTYTDFAGSFIFLLLGLVLIAVVIAFRDLKSWGWYGMVAIHALTVLGALLSGMDIYYGIVLILSAVSLALLLTPPVKECVFGRH
jgi:hypothetical protein